MPTNSSLPSIMSHAFSKIPAPMIQRSSFDRSRTHKTTFDAGKLIPVFLDEILPGDTVNMRATFFARVATLLNPIMDNLFFDTFWFFCPNRLVWDNWEKFQGDRTNPDSTIDYEIPTMTNAGGLTLGEFSLGDYFGLPTQVEFAADDEPSALPFRMYNLIYNEWFRDQNSQDSLTVDKGDSASDIDNYIIRRRGKRHDYFTSCLPWPQKGDAVSLPLGTSAPLSAATTGVRGDGKALGFTDGSGNLGALATNGSDLKFDGGAEGTSLPSAATFGSAAGDRLMGVIGSTATSGLVAELSGITADLSTATAATVNQLREAIAVQQLLETDARGGTRYIEILKSHFGVTVPDFRLQRPEYLGGSTQRIDVRAVPQTSESGTTPQANLSAYAAQDTQSGFVRSFDEHGYIMCLVNVRADITYQQGVDRHWSRRTRYDFYMPALAHLGEQAVLNKEIYYPNEGGESGEADEVFGYQERWAEYRYGVSHVSGSFRSNATGSLDSWHLALDFADIPVLDDGTFIQDDPPVERIAALGGSLAAGQQIIMDSYFSMRHARVMPVYSVPGLERL